MSKLPNRTNRNLWSLNLTDLGKEVEAKDGYGDVRKGYLSKLLDEDSHQIYDGEFLVQHTRREAVINGETYYMWESSTTRRGDYK